MEPHLLPSYVALCELNDATVARADAIIILTDHDGVDYDLVSSADAFVLDTRNRLLGSRERI